MLIRASLQRAVLTTFIVGAISVICLWIFIRSSIEGSVESLPTDAATVDAVSAAAARAAGRAVLIFGSIATLVATAITAMLAARRQRFYEELAERIDAIANADDKSRPMAAADTALAADTLFRRLGEVQHDVQRRIARLDGERWRAFHVLDHMTDGVLAVGSDRRVLLLNPAARDLLGLTRQSLLGRRLADVVRATQIVAAVDAVLGGQEQMDTELTLASAPNRALKVHAHQLPVEDAPGVLVTVRDETQVRQLERMRREFIANVSHELKTPLSAIKGYAETLQLGAKEDAETCTHFLAQIELQAERLERLINDMLQLARAQTGTSNLKLAPVPLTPVLRESLTTYQPLARARAIALHYELAETGATVNADREALLTIVNNLLGNALRYTPEGGNVQVSCRREGDRWMIAVADDGIGIPEEDQERVFERFYRVEKARDASRGGTGLGLSIVKNLVQALDGTVRLRSRPGEGATFEVLLPAGGRDAFTNSS